MRKGWNRRDVLAAGVGAGLGFGLGLTLAPGGSLAQDKAVFRIGALNPVTGSGSAYGAGMQATIKAAAGIVNAAGGAGGRLLEVVAADDQTSPEAAVLAAKKLAEVNGVQAILGTWSSGSTLAVMRSVTLPENLLLMHVSGAEETSDHDKDLVFRFAPSAKSFGVVFAKIAAEFGGKRPAILQFNNESAAAQAIGFAETWKALGHEAPAPIVYQPRRATYRGELQDALRHDPDFLILASYLDDAIVLVREWYQAGSQAKLVMPYWAAGQKLVAELGKEVTEGINIAGSLPAEGSPSFAAFDAEYRRLTGQPGSTNKYAAECWDMVVSLALAMEVAGPQATPAQIAARLRDVTNGPGTEVHGFVEGREALKRGPIAFGGAAGRIILDRQGNNQGPFFTWDVIENGVARTRKPISLI